MIRSGFFCPIPPTNNYLSMEEAVGFPQKKSWYTPKKRTNDNREIQPWMKMYLRRNMVIFQLVMLVFGGVNG